MATVKTINQGALEELLALGVTLDGSSLLDADDDWREGSRNLPLKNLSGWATGGQTAGAANAGPVARALLRATSSAVSSGDILVALSGGVDSRILIACAARVIPVDRIHVVTFAESKEGIEARLAAEVCRALGVRDFRVHVLRQEIYERYAPVIAEASRGEIVPVHLHLLSFLQEYRAALPERLLSGIGADAAAGYAQDDEEDQSRGVDNTRPGRSLRAVCASLRLPPSSFERLRSGLSERFDACLRDFPGRSFSEYFYWTARTERLLLPLAHLYERAGFDVAMPFLDVEAFGRLACCDQGVRRDKRILKAVLLELDERLARIPFFSSSRHFAPMRKRDRLLRLVANRLRLGVEALSNDRMTIRDAWQCEALGRTFRRVFLARLRQVLGKWVESGLVPSECATVLEKRHFKISRGVIQAQFAAVGAAMAAGEWRRNETE